MMGPVHLSRGEDGVASVVIDNPPVNATSHAVRKALDLALNEIETDPTITAVVLSCRGRTFVAGADISEFGKAPRPPLLPDLLSRIESAAKPWVAAIHGSALGGGLELALACRGRVAASDSRLGLPEVTLGLIPGAGGTLRLPRLIGPSAALDMIAGGKPVTAAEAQETGLVDVVVAGDPGDEAHELALRLARRRRPSLPPVRPPTDPAAFEAQKDRIRRRARGQEAPLAAIEAIENAVALDPADALAAERAIFLRLKDGPQCAALRHVFFAERSATRMPRLKGVNPAPVERVGVIGGGTMGAGIATAFLLKGFAVTLIERDSDALETGLARIHDLLAGSEKRGLIAAGKRERIDRSLAGSTDYESLATADAVIEAVFEDMDVKREVFAALDRVTRPEALLATNTSYLDVGEIAEAVSDPARVLGLHFFSPAHVMKLLEIVHPPKVADRALATAFDLGRRLGKITVPSGVCHGFIGNRMMSAYRRECEFMLEDGALPRDIDAAMVEYGFPMGIFQMQDLAGLDISWAMRKRMAATRDPSERYVRIADLLCESGRFGRKSGRGWYDYSADPNGVPDPEVEAIVVAESAAEGITRRSFASAEIMDRILSAMTREGRAILDEGIAASPEAIDVVMINGYGFPRWRGGPMFAAGMTGA